MTQFVKHEAMHERTLHAARSEKSATLVLLEFLMQIEEHRTFSVMGYPSLFKYVEESLGYSPSQTSERISAMRLLTRVPEAAEDLKSGAHTLSSLAKVAQFARRENLDAKQAQALVLKTAHQSIAKIEKHLLDSGLIEPPKMERQKIISKELTRLTLDVDDAFIEQLTRMRELQGNPALSLSDAFKLAMKEFILKRDSKRAKTLPDSPTHPNRNIPLACRAKNQPKESRADLNSNQKTQVLRTSEVNPIPAPEVNSTPKLEADSKLNRSHKPIPHSRYIPRSDQRIAHARATHQCEYVHTQSQKRCNSRTGLQFEHIIPFAKGGASREANLKLLCPAHNRLRAIQAYGMRKMERYLRKADREF